MVEGGRGRSRDAAGDWPSRCRACGQALHGPYCAQCGQSHRHVRLSLRALVREGVADLRSLDNRALRTMAELSLDPGLVVREYLAGRRVPYVDPLRYALATTLVAMLVAAALTRVQPSPVDPRLRALVDWQLWWTPPLTLLSMPALAGVLVPLFWTTPVRLRWIEHLVLVTYALGHAALLQTLLAPAVMRWPQLTPVAAGLPLLLLAWAAVGVYQSRWWTVIPRVLLAVVAVAVLVGMIALRLVPW